MSETVYTCLAIAVATLVTCLTRGLPFLAFSGKQELPDWLRQLGNALPAAIMLILVVYCMRNTDFSSFPFGLAELISIAITVAVHLKKKSTLLSMAVGTACYMILIRTIFPF